MIQFISDLHLDPSRPGVTEAFLQFLSEQAGKAKALYILGDLFELWLGDDDDAPHLEPVKSQLLALTKQGTKLYCMHGNRDFLIGELFCQQTGAALLPDPSIVDLYGHKALLMHGDSLCTDDEDYQEFRREVRDSHWQQRFLHTSLDERRAVARDLRQKSQAMNSRKPQNIMDVNQQEVVRVMHEFDVRLLIHGHTHRPARHSITVDEHPAERIVLGDWDKSAWCLTVTNDAIDLLDWKIHN